MPDKAERSSAPPREIRDTRTLRALTHPVRIALIETLTMHGAMTATEAGEQIGETPTTCSFHLRQLAKYGFVEEAGGGKGRSRPWRVSSIGLRIGGRGDIQSELAADALSDLFRERQLGRYQVWRQSRSGYPKAWRDAASDGEHFFYLTADELKELNDELFGLLRSRFRDRLEDPSARPEGAVPVELLLFSYPLQPPATDR